MTGLRNVSARLRLAPVAAGIAATALLVSALLFHVDQEQARYEASIRAALIGEASGLRAELERAVEARTALLDGMRGFAIAEIADDELTAEGFRLFAEQLQADTDVPLRSIQLAPEAVVTYVYPLEGNEAAIGHDLLADDRRRDAVLETIEARAAVVAGPLELLQGGRAIIIRSPIFVDRDGTEEWWGLATVVADFDPLVAEAGLEEVSEGTAVAVRFVEGRRNDFGQAVFGDQTVFDHDPIRLDVTLPTGRWELGVAPAGGWDSVVWPRRTQTLVGGLLTALLLGVLVGRLVGSRQRYRQATGDLEQLIETAGVPIVQVDADARITGWNDAATELTGVDEDVVLGRTLGGHERVVTAFDDATAAQLVGVIEQVLASGERALGTEVRIATDGGLRSLVVNVSPTRNAVGRTVGALAVAQDISAQLEAEEVRAENRAIVRATRLKDEFLAGMSHELRTPLNGILGLSSILAKRTFGELNDKQEEYVGHIQQSGRHLLELINDVLDLARIEADEGEIERGPVDLRELIGEAVAAAHPAVDRGALHLVVDVPDSLPLVDGDRRRLRQVLDNLLSNACKFTGRGGRVGIDVRVDHLDVVLGVWDTGIGIPEEKQHLLFHPFQQIDSALNRTYGGTGLGLSLTRRLVELHGGSIGVESSEGEGARFTVRFPVGHAIVEPPAEEPAAADGEIVVVLADDHDLNRRLLTDFLGSHGIRVHTAADGIEVVELTRRIRPDVVLMDIQMPRRDGLEATRMLKADQITGEIPVVALTALAMAGDADRCVAAGCDAYVSKPIDPDEVVALIEELAHPVVQA